MVVEVGEKGRRYSLHKAFLCHYSEYFRKALNGPWKEAEDGVVPLKDIEPGVFNVFVNWMYTQKLPGNCEEWCQVGELGEAWDFASEIALILKAYNFGDRFLATAFKRAANVAIVGILHGCAPFYEVVIFAFKNLPAHSPILQLLVDAQCRHWSECLDDTEEVELQKQLPYDFLLRVMKRYSEKVYGDTAWFEEPLARCLYHEHASDEERKECQKK